MSEVERVKPRAMYVEEAIALALDSRWQEAVTINRQLLEKHGEDEDTYNRLGKALSELGKPKEALEAYETSLGINPLNIIAQKNRRKLSVQLAGPGGRRGVGGAIDVDLFTEEPGKSALTQLAVKDVTVVANVNPGDHVELERKNTQLHARTAQGIVLGQVDTKIARRLIPLLTTGNRYAAAVARVEDNRIEIMIREEFQAPENARKSSFPIARGARRDEFRPYAKESLLAARQVDSDSDDDDDEVLGPGPAAADDDLEGMHTVEGDDDAPAAPFDDDDGDEDTRPEDHY